MFKAFDISRRQSAAAMRALCKVLLTAQVAAAVLVFCITPVSTVFGQEPQPVQKAEGQKAEVQSAAEEEIKADSERMIGNIFRQFHATYRIGPADEIAIRVKGQPDYTVDKVKVSPVGSIYHSLLGEVSIAGMTIEDAKKHLTVEFSEYLIDPEVSVELIEAQSAKVGVLGEVVRPGIIIMSRPMTLLDTILEAGGILETGKRSEVIVLRQDMLGNRSQIKVNLKKIMEGKAGPEENIAIHAGDTVIVEGNLKKHLPILTSLGGFGNLLGFLALGGR